MSTVTHFEIFGEDLPKLAEFYEKLFDWRVQKAKAVDYYRISTGVRGDDGIQGGLLHRPIPGPHSWVHYVHVNSIDETVENAVRLGGKLIRPKAAVPKTAWYALLEDPEGNIFAVYQNDPTAFPPPEPD